MQEVVEVCGWFYKCYLNKIKCIQNKIEKKMAEPLSWLIEGKNVCIVNTIYINTLYKLKL